jgi:glycosyltransferase involved in cell wall biosynthesis
VNAPVRVTLVANELRGFRPVGGMGTATTFLALALARMGHAVEILIGWRHSADAVDPQWGDVYRRAGIRLRSAPPSGERVAPAHFELPRRVERALRTDPPDVVITQDVGAPAYSALRLRQAGVAFDRTLFVVFCHGPRRYILELSRTVGAKDLRDILGVGALEGASVELADVVVSPSAYLLDWMRSMGWKLPQRTLVVPYFTRSSALGERVPRREGGGEPLQRLAFFGRLDEKKGIRLFAAGLNSLEPRLLTDVAVVFVGKPTRTWPVERTESLLSEATRRALRGVSFETQLDQQDALGRLARPGTLAVMPSLQENSPNAVYECLEHGIPFIASNVGGVPELIAEEDHERVLFEPTPAGIRAALTRALAGEQTPRAARPSFAESTAFEKWREVVALRPRPRRQTTQRPDVDVIVRPTQAPSLAGTAPNVLFLDEDDLPDERLIETLVSAQQESGADAVTCGVRVIGPDGEATVHLFSGEPGGLGVIANWYGAVALVRRSAVPQLEPSWPAERDTAWHALNAVALAGGRIVSVPLPLVTRAAAPGSVERDSGDALLVAHQAERALPFPLRATARVAAGLAASTTAQERPTPRLLPRLLQRLHLASAR